MDNQEVKDIELVKNDRFGKSSYSLLPDDRKTEAVTIAAINAYPYNIRKNLHFI